MHTTGALFSFLAANQNHLESFKKHDAWVPSTKILTSLAQGVLKPPQVVVLCSHAGEPGHWRHPFLFLYLFLQRQFLYM